MKKIFLLLSSFLLISLTVSAQTPQGINYQGVARNATGQAMGMQAIGLRFTILQSGSPVYVETHTATTDTFGLYSKVIGQGTPQTGSFSGINWALGNYAVQVEIDPGTGYQNVGTMSLMSVPYSLYTQNAANSSSIQNQPVSGAVPQSGDVLQYNAGVWTPTAGTTGVSSVSTTAPVTNAGTAASPIIGITQAGTASDGYLSQADWNLFNSKGSFISLIIPTNSGLLPAGTYTNSISLSADNMNPIWNAGFLAGTPVSTTAPLSNDVLKFNGTTWAPGPGPLSLPTPTVGSLLFSDLTNNWTATNPAQVSSDGNSITVVNTTTVGTAGTFITNNASAGSVPALKAQSNSSTGYAFWADNTAGAAILATSGGPYAITGDLSFGGGNAIVGRLVNSSSGTAIMGSVDNTSIGKAGEFYNMNPANDSATLFSYSIGKGPALFAITQGISHAGAFAIDNAASAGSAVIGSTNGSGKAVFGINQGTGYAGAFWISNPANDSAAVAGATNGNGPAVLGLNSGAGSAGDFQIANPGSASPALRVNTIGTGYSGQFTGGAGLQTDKLQVTNNPVTGYVLTSDALGNATWQAPGGSGLPGGALGQVMYHDGLTWLGSNTSNLTFTGTKMGIGTPSPVADLDVMTNGIGLQVVSNATSTGYSMKALQFGNSQAGYFEINNSANTSDAIYSQTNGNGNAIKGYTNAFGNGVMGWNDNQSGGGAGVMGYATGLGNAGRFEIQNATNGVSALRALTSGTGYSGEFSGGAGVLMDALTVQGAFRYPVTPVNGYVLTSDAAGNASWQPAAGGVSSITANNPLVNSGTATNPILDMSPSGVVSAMYGSATAIPQITVDTWGRVTNATNINIAGLLPAGANGQMLYNSSGTWTVSAVSNLFFNGTNMGVGNSNPAATLDVASTNTLATIQAVNSGTASGSRAVSGRHTGNGAVYGVFGEATGSGGSAGVYGFASNATGTNNYGVGGVNQNPSSGYGVFGQGMYGVYGQNNSASGYGVFGVANTGGSTAVGGLANQNSGKAADFQVTSSVNASSALSAGTAGTGPAGTFSVTAATNTSAALIAGTSGTGPAMQSNGRLVVMSDANSKVYVQGSSTAVPNLLVMRSNGTLSAPSAPIAGMSIGTIGFSGHNGTSFNTTMLAGMRAAAAQVYAAGAMGTDLYFQTTPLGSTTALDRMTIDRAGNVGIGASPLQLFDVAGKFQVTSGGNIVQINGVTTSFPAAQGAAGTFLQNDGAGNLSWANASASAWGLLGNAGTVDGTNFIGTTDNVALTIRVNNQRAGRIAPVTNSNTSFGYQALLNPSGNYNVAMGFWAMNKTTTGLRNVSIGHESMYNNLNGGDNTAVGFQAMYAHQSGFYNVAIGENTLIGSTSGSYNTAVGNDALATVITTTASTGVGYGSLWNANADNNSALGYLSLSDVTSGTNNVGVGYFSGKNSFSGNNNTFIGANSGFPTATQRNNATAVGYNAKVDQDNALVLGDMGVSVGIGTTTPGAQLDIGASAVPLSLRVTNNSANGMAAYLNSTVASNTVTVLQVSTVGQGSVGEFKNTNGLNPRNTLSAETNGSGSAVIGTNTGNGRAAFFEINTNNTNSSDALYAATFGTGRAAYFEIGNSANNSPAMYAITNGGSPAVQGMSTGTSNAGYFQILNAGNNNAALYATTSGGGPALAAAASATGLSASFSGGNGMKTDGFTAMLKTHPGGALALTGTDYFLVIPSGLAGSVTLPSPVGASMVGKIFILKNLGAAAFPLAGGSTYTSIGGVSGQGNIPGSSVIRLISDGSSWQAW